jgi:PAS domain S-box-containing protein
MDITERLGIEETLRNSEEKWRTLVENDPVVSLTADRAGMIRTINRSLPGRTPADFVGKCIQDFTLTDADRQRSVDCLQRVVASGRAESFAVDSFAPDGRPVRLRNVLAPIVSGGQVTSVIGVAMDVTAETEAFMALRESEARLRDIVERMGDWLLECDPSWRLTYSSPQVRQLLGYTAEEMIGKSPMETVMPEEREHLAAAMAEFLRAKTPIRDVEVWHLRKDGHRVCLSVSGAPILDEGGEVRGMRAVVHDVTERKNFEAKMLQAQKLESLGILAGGIAHDFNNLLAAILGNAEIALAEIPSGGAARESIEQIEKAGLHAAQLTRQMLAYAGRGSITLQPVAVPDVVRDMFELLRSSISKHHEFVVDFPEGLPAVMGDPSQVRQIVMNLVMNASEAIGEGD